MSAPRQSMWFKNLFAYRLPADWNVSAAALEEALSQRTLLPCGAFDMASRGWVAPSGTGRLVHTVNGHLLVALGVDEKVLPGVVVKQQVAAKAAMLAEEQGFPVGRRQLRELRLKVTEELRGRALTRVRVTRAWIDPLNGWFVIDAAGGSRADEVVETMRATLGTFAVQLVETQRSPQLSMSAWLSAGEVPGRFTIDEDLELQAVDRSKATVKYAHHALDGREIRAHLTAGKFVRKLGFTWNDRIAFVLTDKLQVKRMQFLHIITDAVESEAEISADEQLDIDFTLMSGELARLLSDLVDVLGGAGAREETPAREAA